MLNKLKYLLIGPPIPTHEMGDKRLNKLRALAAFSPDALSSVAYANQEIYLGLVVAGSAGLALGLPIGLAITGLLSIVALSYYQTVHAYPSGGGSYVVARENLGPLPGLFTAAALLFGYLLTAAVSLTAGVEALASAFPTLWQHRVLAALLLLLVMMVVNLRGLRETGTLMAIPVYLFLLTYLPMMVYGVVRVIVTGSANLTSTAPAPVSSLSLFLVLHAFSAGCTALTGIEAISNGVPVFESPEVRNAGRTLIVMAFLMGILFLSSTGLIQSLGIVAAPQETILAALTRRLLGSGLAYIVIQVCTTMILVVAANTSFAGFPRLAAILAGDGYLPRQLTSLGDRLVFANGITALAVATGALIVIFGGNSHALIPLFAIGVFMAFTLSQAGMVLHWVRQRGSGWQIKSIINGVGALVTGATVLIIGISKFLEGAWITVVVIPLVVIGLRRIRAHYRQLSKALSLRGLPPSLKPYPAPRVVIPISGVHRGVIDAVAFAQSVSKNVTAVYVELEPGAGEKVRETWERWWPQVPLEIVPSPYRSVIGPLLDFLDRTDAEYNDGQQSTVILPEFVPAHWWQALLHNQTAWMLKTILLYRRRQFGYQRAIIDIPYHIKQ